MSSVGVEVRHDPNCNKCSARQRSPCSDGDGDGDGDEGRAARTVSRSTPRAARADLVALRADLGILSRKRDPIAEAQTSRRYMQVQGYNAQAVTTENHHALAPPRKRARSSRHECRRPRDAHGRRPSLGVTGLACAQAAIGAAAAILLSACVAAAGEWAPAGKRARVLSWTLLGQPAAWVAGMPLIGVISQLDSPRRAPSGGSLARPCRAPATRGRSDSGRNGAGLAPTAGGALGRRRVDGAIRLGRGARLCRRALHPVLRTVYGGDRGAPRRRCPRFPGTLLARRHTEHHARALLIVLGLTAAAGTALLGLVRPSPAASLVLFAACMAAIGGRTIAGSAFGLDAARDQRVAVMSLRAAAVQFGYLLGAACGGAAAPG